jgi:hypothetical protein
MKKITLVTGASVGLIVACGQGTSQLTGHGDSGPNVTVEGGVGDDGSTSSDGGFKDGGMFGMSDASSCANNQPMCACTTAGQTASCWTGPPGGQGVGACHPGTTTCLQMGEFSAWGPCTGEQLDCTPDSGVVDSSPPPIDSGHVIEAGPPPQSCLPGSSLTALISGANVTGYIPVGSWGETGTGVLIVPIEGTGAASMIATPQVVNTCGGNSVTGEVVCTSNATDVYIINGTALTTTLTSGANSQEGFSGGSCSTCNVAVDPSSNTAYLSIGVTAGAAYQPLNLATNSLLTPISANTMATSESLLVDTVRGYVLSPNEQSDYQILKTATGQVYDFSFSGASPVPIFDSPGEDCTTGIAMATDESQGTVVLVDLTQAQFTGTTWSAPYNIQSIPEFMTFSAGTDAISVASNSHIGVVTGEFGGDGFGVFVMPSTSGTGTPALVDWVAANIPSTPDSMAWSMGEDPHTLTTYTSPTSGKQYAIFEDDVSETGMRTYVAIVDMNALLARPRAGVGTHTLATPLGAADTCMGTPGALVPNPAGCIVRFQSVN